MTSYLRRVIIDNPAPNFELQVANFAAEFEQQTWPSYIDFQFFAGVTLELHQFLGWINSTPLNGIGTLSFNYSLNRFVLTTNSGTYVKLNNLMSLGFNAGSYPLQTGEIIADNAPSNDSFLQFTYFTLTPVLTIDVVTGTGITVSWLDEQFNSNSANIDLTQGTYTINQILTALNTPLYNNGNPIATFSFDEWADWFTVNGLRSGLQVGQIALTSGDTNFLGFTAGIINPGVQYAQLDYKQDSAISIMRDESGAVVYPPGISPTPAPSSTFKRSKINLFDASTGAQHFMIEQAVDSTLMDFPTVLNFRDAFGGNREVLDVIDHLLRVDGNVESRIADLQSQNSAIESSVGSLTTRADSIDTSLIALDSRASAIENEVNVVLETRADSNLARLGVNDADLDAVEGRISVVDSRTDVNEADIDALEGRASAIENEVNVVLETRADSNLARLGVNDTDLDLVENRISVVDSRTDVNEADIDALEVRASAIENEVNVVLETRADSNLARLGVNDADMDSVEGRISSVDSRTDDNEADIVDLQNSFTNHEAYVEDIKDVLFAITDGTLESNLSSLQEITAALDNNTNSEADLAELHQRLSDLYSVIEQLTESVAYP